MTELVKTVYNILLKDDISSIEYHTDHTTILFDLRMKKQLVRIEHYIDIDIRKFDINVPTVLIPTMATIHKDISKKAFRGISEIFQKYNIKHSVNEEYMPYIDSKSTIELPNNFDDRLKLLSTFISQNGYNVWDFGDSEIITNELFAQLDEGILYIHQKSKYIKPLKMICQDYIQFIEVEQFDKKALAKHIIKQAKKKFQSNSLLQAKHYLEDLSFGEKVNFNKSDYIQSQELFSVLCDYLYQECEESFDESIIDKCRPTERIEYLDNHIIELNMVLRRVLRLNDENFFNRIQKNGHYN